MIMTNTTMINTMAMTNMTTMITTIIMTNTTMITTMIMTNTTMITKIIMNNHDHHNHHDQHHDDHGELDLLSVDQLHLLLRLLEEILQVLVRHAESKDSVLGKSSVMLTVKAKIPQIQSN